MTDHRLRYTGNVDQAGAALVRSVQQVQRGTYSRRLRYLIDRAKPRGREKDCGD